MTTPFDTVASAPIDAILKTVDEFKRDPSPKKINLAVGVYQDDTGKTPILECIRKASAEWLAQETSKEYIPADGSEKFVNEAGILIFGEESWKKNKTKMVSLQAVGGCGALKVGADLLQLTLGIKQIHVSNPTWDNHKMVFEQAGMHSKDYPYYDSKKQMVDFDRLCSAMRSFSENSVVLLHASCHNPTGSDLTRTQWDEIATIVRAKKLIPFFDCAYLGFSKDPEADLYPIRKFLELGIPYLLAFSFSKCIAVYRERVGALFIVTHEERSAAACMTQLKNLVRANYSRPPGWGAHVVAKVLAEPELKKLWLSELETMRARTQDMRERLYHGLHAKAPSLNCTGLKTGVGLFTMLDLTPSEVQQLKESSHIYMLESGRICIAALRAETVDFVSDAIAQIVRDR